MRAALLFRPNRHYRADEFARGLGRHGYQVCRSPITDPGPSDVLVIWNRTRRHEAEAARFERAGGRVIVAENGYLDRHGGEKHYALALGSHNGPGRWFVGDKARYEIDDQPWGSRGESVLVLAQRGIGQPGIAMPLDWIRTVMAKLARITQRPILLRRHPGLHGFRGALESDIAKAHCAVTWGSGAGIKAICAGLPCFHELDGWIGNSASARLADSVEQCDTPDRGLLWRRITWAQWTMREIECGEAFDRLLHAECHRLFCARTKPILHDRQGDAGGHPPLRRANEVRAVHQL